MAYVSVTGSGLGNALQEIMGCDGIVPGDAVSYGQCKTIYAYHPLGAKLAEKPVEMAQSQERKVEVNAAGGKQAVTAFLEEWSALDADGIISQVAITSRIYGIASVAVLVKDQDPAEPLDVLNLAGKELAFNVFDPLNTSGSLVVSQEPNSPTFLKPRGDIAVQGQRYHSTRCVTKMNERPVYIEYTTSAYGYVGRSVYQRTLYPLKSFLNTMVADDMVARKAGIIVAKQQPAGSIVDRFQQAMSGVKRNVVKEAENDNVISIGPDEDVSAISLQNVHQALGEARRDILNNIASGAGMPAKLVNEETFAQGFGEGSEDSRHVAQYIDQYRRELAPLYRFFDTIAQVRAWTPEFVEALKAENADDEAFQAASYEEVFLALRRGFKATWPSLIEEPEQTEFELEQLRLEAVAELLQVLIPALDPLNRAALIEWVQDNLNAFERLFATPLNLDLAALAAYDPMAQAAEMQGGEPAGEEPPAGRADSLRQAYATADGVIRRLQLTRPGVRSSAKEKRHA